MTMSRLSASVALMLAMAVPAVAHHGWSWTTDGYFQVEGIIREIYLGNPHAFLDVDVEGELWRVELATAGATARAGFVEASAKVGDEVIAVGNRSQDEAERRMKAVRITIGGKSYDVYPGRVPPA